MKKLILIICIILLSAANIRSQELKIIRNLDTFVTDSVPYIDKTTIFFLASRYCGASDKEFDVVQDMVKYYGTQVKFYIVDMDKSRNIDAALQNYKELNEGNGKVPVPSILLYNTQGKVVGIFAGYLTDNDMKKEINKILPK